MQQTTIDRRRWLKSVGLTGAAALLAGRADAAPTTAPSSRKRALRVAHLTDVHVEPELSADRGMAACLDHVNAQADRPGLILVGGDCVYESMHHDAARTRLQWDLWHKVMADHNAIPVEPCIGNHDVWGWNHKKARTTGTEPLYGKRNALAQLKLDKSYRSFDRAGWHFVVLDSIYPNGNTYQARLDDAQHEWLAADLAAVDPRKPVLVMSHIPILSITGMIDPKATEGADTIVSGGVMHEDFRRLRDLFRGHPNVKLALSGHTHLLDRIDTLGMTYICDGAVSGDWWKGSHLGECDPGYGLLDLYDDGTFDHRYVTYGWRAVPGADPA